MLKVLWRSFGAVLSIMMKNYLLPNKHTQFKTTVQTLYPIRDQNRYPISDQVGWKPYPLAPHTPKWVTSDPGYSLTRPTSLALILNRSSCPLLKYPFPLFLSSISWLSPSSPIIWKYTLASVPAFSSEPVLNSTSYSESDKNMHEMLARTE